MSYTNLLNAIKNTAAGIPLTPEEEDTMILLNEQMINFPLIKSQVGVVRNQILATATKQWVSTGNKSITGNNTYSGVSTFSGSLIATGTVQLANYKKTTAVSETTSSSITIYGTDAIYDLSVSSASDISLTISDITSGESRSFDVIIPCTASGNQGYVQLLTVNDSHISFVTELENTLTSNEIGTFMKQHFDIWNIDGTVKACSSIRYYNIPSS